MAIQLLPVPKSERQPLSDAQGLSGYRLETLLPLTLPELQSHQEDVEEAVYLLRKTGFCHGDLSMSNIMQDMQGAIRFIEFGFAGKIGHSVSNCIPT